MAAVETSAATAAAPRASTQADPPHGAFLEVRHPAVPGPGRDDRRATEEPAPLVGLTEAGLSKHLRQLAVAGLVVTRRDGYYVLYDLDRERLAELGPDLLAFISR